MQTCDGRNVPINDATIGHIVDGKYVAITTEKPIDVSPSLIDLKDWTNVVLSDRLFSGTKEELLAVHSQADTMKVYCMAILRACNKGIKDGALKEAYETSFLSEFYPEVPLSKNTVSTFLDDLGKTMSHIVQFMRDRTAAVVMDHHLLIDGTLKSNESKVNSLSDFSRKARTKGTRDISVLFIFDLEEMEFVCSRGFLGNMLDATSNKAFISQNKITKGIIVGDKGFPESAEHEHFEQNPDLHYLNPVKHNSKLIERLNMLDFTDILPGYEGITYRKEKCGGTNKWLYSYRDRLQGYKGRKRLVAQGKEEQDI